MELGIQVPLTDPFTGEVFAGIALRGLIDLVDRTELGLRVIDLKTMARSPSMPMAHMSLELALYAFLMAYPEYWDARPTEGRTRLFDGIRLTPDCKIGKIILKWFINSEISTKTEQDPGFEAIKDIFGQFGLDDLRGEYVAYVCEWYGVIEMDEML